MNDTHNKVLIVDDDESLCHALSFKLQGEGMTTEVARTGEAGLERIETFAPDVVLLDINMPGMSGTELLARYNKQSHTQNVKFIILTNQADTDTLSDVFMHEVTDFVDKAATPIDDIVALVHTRLSAVGNE